MPNTGPVRARDLRANIKELGFEQGVVRTLELFLDEYAAHRTREREMIQMMDHIIDELGKFIRLGEGLQTMVEEIKRHKDQGEQHNGSDKP